jgi:precorrin-2 dehydrogenase/sirohydrochlorin ferrochelatase/precorrin-6A/cobalt-precorrin-6A reductase
MTDLFIFAGTTEGRMLVDELCRFAPDGENGQIDERSAVDGLSNFKLRVYTATEYGSELLAGDLSPEAKQFVTLCPGRLDIEGIYDELIKYQPEYVIDCTHPHAPIVTENIFSASQKADIKYLRLLREKTEISSDTNATFVSNLSEAAEFLSNKSGNILLATGSKELEPFAKPELRERTIVRMLPIEGNIQKSLELGYKAANLICMQGPFSEKLNRAIIRQFDIAYVVTKDSGKTGGLGEKLQSAVSEGAHSVIVRQPDQVDGYDIAGILSILGRRHSWFPMFQNISDQKIVVIGGGKINLRRVKTLLNFDCQIQIISPELCPELAALAAQNPDFIHVIKRPYQEGDCASAFLVTAATNIREVNHAIAVECAQAKIPISVADLKQESSFYFPAVITKGDLVLGLTSGGFDHKLLSSTTAKLRNILNGDTNDQN